MTSLLNQSLIKGLSNNLSIKLFYRNLTSQINITTNQLLSDNNNSSNTSNNSNNDNDKNNNTTTIKLTSISQLGESPTLTESERLLLRRDPMLSLFVNLIMKNGEKNKAEKLVNKTLFLLRQRTLSNPYETLQLAIEKVSPLMKTKSSKIGSKTVQVPRAISKRKGMRIGINWILQFAKKRKSKNSSEKFANEIVAIINGDSQVLAKKLELHKLILANRSNAILGR